jgi:hypothetical protein
MSEFTDGILCISRDDNLLRKVAQDMPSGHLFHKLNDKWTTLLPDRQIAKTTEISDWLQKASQQMPLLDFYHGEDHGWGYRLFQSGVLVASLAVDYDIDWNMKVEIFEKRHPGVNFYTNLSTNEVPQDTEPTFEEIHALDDYQEKVAQQYKYKNISEFSVFDIEPSALEQLDKFLTPDTYIQSMFAQVTHFKRLLGFIEMSWMSYLYLTQTDWGKSLTNSQSQ